MKKTLTFFLLLLAIAVSCNDSGEENNQNQTKDSIVEVIDTKNSNNQTITSDNQNSENDTEQQALLKQEDEKIVFSFDTEKGKTMDLLLQKDDKYLVYRFGTKDKVELQFPEKIENTFDQFTYNYYFRGGGGSNEGLDLNYISFQGDTHKFIVYEEHSFDEGGNEQTDVGIRIVDLKTNKEVKIKGLSKTVKGSLVDFRFNDLVKVEEGEI